MMMDFMILSGISMHRSPQISVCQFRHLTNALGRNRAEKEGCLKDGSAVDSKTAASSQDNYL